MNHMNDSAWIAQHPYLKELADFHSIVEETIREVSLPEPSIPIWDDHATDFRAGTPLLLGSLIEIEHDPASRAIAAGLERLSRKPLRGDVTRQCQALLPDALDPSGQVVDWLLQGQSPSSDSGCFQFLGWTVFASFLAPVVEAFSTWRDEDAWLLNYCPVCGALPSMGQLVDAETGRLRLLRCGRCKCRWRYRRTACPFCDNADDHRLATLSVRNEPFRIDYCEGCRGYLKTYTGEGNENCLLADWTTLHLDLAALDRGLKRCGTSLYEI
jgi:FdhE protein